MKHAILFRSEPLINVRFISVILMLLFSIQSVQGQLSGTKTIGPSGDYTTISEAVEALETQGVSGPVVFNIADGTYTEQFEINAITGTSETNTVTFQSDSQDSSKVIIRHEAVSEDDNYIVRFNGPSHIIFKQVSFKTAKSMYGRAIYFENFTQYVEFLNCDFRGIYHGDNTARYRLIFCSNVNIDYLTFRQCHIDSTGAGISLASGHSEYLIRGIQIIDNTFSHCGYASIHLNHTHMPQITHNNIQECSIGIKLNSAHGPTLVSRNIINADNEGMELHLLGYGGDEALIANNFVSSASQNGMDISGHYINIFHNSIYSSALYSESSALYFYGIQNPNSVKIINNNICRMREGKALYIDDGWYINECRNNNLYTPGNFIAYWDSVKCVDIAELQLKSAMNEASLSVYPHFISMSDLHTIAPWLDGKGFPIVDFTDDIDGEQRDEVNPDIGADEFTPDPSHVTPLNGSYDVGGGFYPTIKSAIDDIVLKGISGPVTLNILPGTYVEQNDLYKVPGAGSLQRVTFRSASGDTSDVRILFEATNQDSNYVFRNYGADFITYEGLTFQATGESNARILDLYLGSDSLEVNHCHFIGIPASGAQTYRTLIASDDSYYRHRLIQGNTFEKGSYAIYMRRDQSNFKHSLRTEIIANTVIENGYTAFYLQFYDGLTINENTIEGSSHGIYCISSDNAAEIQKNRILLKSGGSGIYLTNCSASSQHRGIVTNNFISNLSSSSAKGIELTNTTYLNVYHNSVLIESANREAKAFHLTSGSSHDINILNNNFSCLSNGYAYYVEDVDAIYVSDYNNFYSPSNFLARWGAGTCQDFHLLKSYSGKDAHSVSVYPHYRSGDDLHTTAPWLDNRGTPVTEVTEDIDGQSRSVLRPDIGADEFAADPAHTTPLAGSYTIGSGGDYSTIQEAIDDAVMKGVSQAVDFNILPGTYNEQIQIISIPNTNPDRTLSIQSQSGDTSDVEITFSPTSQDINYVIQFFGSDFIQLKNLKLSSKGRSYARVIDLYLGSDSLLFAGNSFHSVYKSGSDADKICVYSADSYHLSRILSENVFHTCSYGVYMRRGQSNLPHPIGTKIQGNKFLNIGYMGIYLQFQDAPHIIGNNIDSDTYGMQALTCKNELRILKNKINAGSQVGLQISSSDAGLYHHSLIANNFIHVSGTNKAYGLYTVSSSYQDIIHNSIHISGTHATDGRAFYAASGDELLLKNNIFANTGGGYAFYTANPAIISDSDHNDFYSTGENLAYWEGNRADLPALQAAGNMDDNSVSIDPQYASQTDLHVANAGLDGMGSPFEAVFDDIDGQNRHPQTPDIGADEFLLGPNNAPTLVNAIPDTVLAEDATSNLIRADLNIVFEDPDANDVLSFSALSSDDGINAVIDNVSLYIQYKTDYIGSAEIVVRATDLGGLFVTDTFVVDITDANDPPVATDDYVRANTYIPIEFPVLANDSDPDKDPITIISAGQPAQGTTEVSAENNAVIYQTNRYHTGLDSFMYSIEDQRGGSDSAMVYIEVIPLLKEIETDLIDVSHGSVAWGDMDNDNDLDLAISGWLGETDLYASKVYRNDAGVFTDIEANLLGVSSGSPGCIEWGEGNNDGQLDLFLSGMYESTPSVEYSSRMYLNFDLFFMNTGYSDLLDVTSGSCSWGDYNNDGLADMLLSGNPESGEDITNIYRHYDDLPGGSDFLNIDAGFQGIWGGRSCWVDFDNDGDLDVFVCGSGADPSLLYENREADFFQMNAPLPSVYNADAAWGDYDSDGDQDLVLCGISGENAMTSIYRNDGPAPQTGWIFTDIQAGITALESGSVDWGDLDNDGDLDLFITGKTNGSDDRTEVFLNHEGQFESFDSFGDLTEVARSDAALADYDNDHDLDIILTGFADSPFTTIIENQCVTPNTSPAKPNGLSAEVSGNSVTFHWSPAYDMETESNALSYNLHVRTEGESNSVISSLSSESGIRKVVRIGNAGQDTSWTLKDLDPGKTYFWKVQAIDNGFSGSEFSDELAFFISGIKKEQKFPQQYALHQNYPNPFNPGTKILFELPESEKVILTMYAVTGEKVGTLVNKVYPAGQHTVFLDASSMAGGLYFYRIQAGKYQQVRKMLLIK